VARRLRAAGTSARDVVTALVSGFGASRNAAYRLAHEDQDADAPRGEDS
jgi:hypothetical protein